MFDDNDCGCVSEESGCHMPDVRQRCDGRASCVLDVTQQYIGTSTCRGFSDYMFIEYRCVAVRTNATIDACASGFHQRTSGFIQSPRHPQPYPNNQNCHCELSTEDAAITVQILELQVRDVDCTSDYVTLQYGAHQSRLCGQSNGLRETIETNSQQVSLDFRSDSADADLGFWMKYEGN